VAIAATCLFCAGRAQAGFSDGLAAYDAGDYGAAYQAWLPLARAGDGDAQAAIADLYLSGLLDRPVGANARRRINITAVWWYRQAARCGHVIAQLNLGDLYADGVAVERDLVEAYLWLGLAARGGNAWAERRRGGLAGQLTPGQLAAASDRLDAWTPAPDCPR